MIPSTYDVCLLSVSNPKIGDDQFIKSEERELKKASFTSNEREQLTVEHPIDFNGGHITLHADSSITLSQNAYDKTLKLIEDEPVDLLNSRGGQKLNYAKGLKFVKLDKNSLKLIVFTNSSFANLKDFYSQISYICVLTDKYENANIVHWSFTCYKRVTRSVLASELYAISEGFDMASALKATIEQIMEINVLPLVMATDSKSLYDCVVKLNTTREKRLIIDLMCLRQAYERKEISEVI
ncbi:uncharacterized protein RCO7_09774 [Rhynchosporium graminicola]|uniref:Reverse transcriptase Ty1/copia-type domain-containing protein n=1 Tax=Rhynchosporium graminicola TaxID=2792576 RepID=A0A1E1LAK6_9HELO|nr:uncharacterized protein RCO7_09774 [Rhynchosporium commune]